jgi:hypothetical protein
MAARHIDNDGVRANSFPCAAIKFGREVKAGYTEPLRPVASQTFFVCTLQRAVTRFLITRRRGFGRTFSDGGRRWGRPSAQHARQQGSEFAPLLGCPQSRKRPQSKRRARDPFLARPKTETPGTNYTPFKNAHQETNARQRRIDYDDEINFTSCRAE